jgi:hypothetical protein
MTYTCTVCGDTRTEPVAKTPDHEFGDWTPDNEGVNHTRSCACGESESAQHTFGAGVVTKYANHLEEGTVTYTCTVCGFERTNTVPKTRDHSFGQWEPLATVSGKHFCSCPCGETKTADCTYDSGVITAEPTYDAEGTTTYTCSVCGGTKSESIPQLVKVDEITANGNTGATIAAPTGSSAVLDQNTVLNVQEVNSQPAPAVKENIAVVTDSDKAEVLATYDISLLLDGAAVQPGGKVEVTLPAPEGAEEYESLQVVYIADDGSVTPCETRINEDGTITFVTDHFSRYAIVGVPAASSALWITISVVSVALIAAVVIALIVFKKKKGIA